jgi:hypothetical protein
MKGKAAPLYHPNGSLLLSHFIRPEYLLALLKYKAFCLIRQDCQSDPADGVLPPKTFTDPHQGQLEQSLGANADFLVSQAHAVAALRKRTFIMSWTCDPAGHMRETYGEQGRRCELHASGNQLKHILGYEWFPGAEFPPKPRPVPEFPGGRTSAELKEAFYTDGTRAVPVIPSAFATAHKGEKFEVEAEFRIEAIVVPDHVPVPPAQDKILWPMASFAGLTVTIGSKVPDAEAAEIEHVANSLGIPVRRAPA